jgi:uncharacterized membrane protein
MKSLFKKSLVTAYALMLAGSAYAQGGLNLPQVPPSQGGQNTSVGQNLNNVVSGFKNITTGIYSSLFVVALILFFIGIFKFLGSKDAGSKADGYKFMGFGIVALFVMVGVWGLVGFLSSNLGIGVGGDIPTPGVPSSVRTY